MKKNFQYPMTKGNSPAAPGSARRATEGWGWVVGRGVDPADRNRVAPLARQCLDSGGPPCRRGFTLIEVLASMAVLVVLILALTRMFVEASSIAKRGSTMLMRNSTMETAMETLLQDSESMMVNDRLACYVRANTTDDPAKVPDGFGFDDVWFISTSGDQDDDIPYEYNHFYVTNNIVTNSLGAPYVRFSLIKARCIFAVGDQYGVYAFDPADTQWWENMGSIRWDAQVLADNVVRFDIYCLGWDGSPWAGGDIINHFDSTEEHTLETPDGTSIQVTGVSPAAFDIYLQITSPEVAVESGMALVDGVDAATQRKAREMMIRDSSSLFGRAVPVNGVSRYNTVTVYGTNNTAYYEN